MKFKILKIPFEAGNPTGATSHLAEGQTRIILESIDARTDRQMRRTSHLAEELTTQEQTAKMRQKGTASAPELICKEAKIKGELVEVGDLEETNQNILKAASGKRTLAIGGDHSITYALVKAVRPEALLYFDAHLDCEDDFLPPSHEDVIQAIVNDRVVKPENIFIFGARKFYPKELEFVKKRGINVVENMDLGVDNILPRFKRIYLSVDIDVFDPEEAPGTDYPVEIGLRSREFFEFLENLEIKKLAGIDITEVNPAKDSENKTIKLAARIIKRFL